MSAGIAIALVSGTFIAVQSRINGELGTRLHNGVLAALISFGSGLVIISVITALVPSGRAGVAAAIRAIRERTQPWWLFVGGAFGAVLVLAQGLAAGVLGVALFTVAVVAGQTVSGLVIDRVGVGSMPPRPISWTRITGAALTLVAALIAASDRLGAGPGWLMLLPLLAGLGTSFQSAVNGQVRELTSVTTATFGNFVVGTAVLAIGTAIWIAATGWRGTLPTDPWLYVGGTMGLIFIGLNTVLVRTVGVLLLSLCLIAGQLTGSIVLDLVLPVPGHSLQPVTVIGAVLTFVAILITVLPTRRNRAGR